MNQTSTSSLPRLSSLALVVLASGWLLAAGAILRDVVRPGRTLEAEIARDVRLASDLEDLFTGVCERVEPAVVSVGTADAGAEETGPEASALPVEAGGHGSIGSGFVIDPAGYILTNHHVVRDAGEISVKLHDGREFPARVVETDSSSDIALLKIEADGLQVLPLGESKKARVGLWVLAIGSPFGLAQTVSAGIVSATCRSDLHILPFESFLQTDAAIHPGNSGGPLVNLRGEAIGINTAMFSNRGGSSQGIGFAVPIDLARALARRWIAGRRECYLGLQPLRVDNDIARYYELQPARGAFVAGVSPDGPAAQGGVRPKDVILSLGGSEVRDENHLRVLIADCAPGEEVEVEVLRGRTRQRLQVVPRERSGPPPEPGPAPPIPKGEPATRLGITVAPLDAPLAEQLGVKPDRNGLAVLDVLPTSPAARRGIHEGDLIVAVNDRPVKSLADLKAALEDSHEVVLLEVLRGESQSGYFFVGH